MPAPMPAALVLIVCKTILSGPEDQNSAFTGYENREWATEHSMMICRRQEVALMPMDLIGTNPSQNLPAPPEEFTLQKCQRTGMMMGTQWDASHRSSAWRFWRVACPVPIVRRNPDGSEEIIAWKMPECGHRDTVVCEVDTEI